MSASWMGTVRLNDMVWRAKAQDRMLCRSLMTSRGVVAGEGSG